MPGLMKYYINQKAQLPHTYYFTTHILVLKFVNKVVFWGGKSRIHIFLEKGGILVLTFMNLEKNGLFLISSFLPWKGGLIWAEKSVFYCKKWVILSWKVSVLPQKRGSFSNWRTRMGTIFFSEWGSRARKLYFNSYILPYFRLMYGHMKCPPPLTFKNWLSISYKYL